MPRYSDSPDHCLIFSLLFSKKFGSYDQLVTISFRWDSKSSEVMREALMQKFGQHGGLLNELLATGEATLAECSPKDLRWGIGEIRCHIFKNTEEVGGAIHLITISAKQYFFMVITSRKQNPRKYLLYFVKRRTLNKYSNR